MKTQFAAVLILAALGLSACGKAAVSSPESRAAAPSTAAKPDEPTSVAQNGERPVIWEPVLGTNLADLRIHAPFSVVLPTYVPDGLALQDWSVGFVSVGENGPGAMFVTMRFGGSGEASLTIMESKGDLRLPVATKGDLGDSEALFSGTSILFSADDIHLLVIGQDLSRDSIVKTAASMLPRVGNGTGASAGNEGGATLEQTVPELFKGSATSEADARRIIELLPKLDWSKLSRQDDRLSMELLEWLDQRPIDDLADIKCMLWGTTGLDGASAEAYSSVLGTLFSSDPVKFVKALGTLPEGQANQVTSLVAYYAAYERPDILRARDQLQSLLHSSALTELEAKRAEKLLSDITTPPWEQHPQ